MNQGQYRGLIERIDPATKIKRIEMELNGDPATGAPGLRAAWFNTYRDVQAQTRLVETRGRMKVPPPQQAMADADMERALYQLSSLQISLEYLADSIAAVEAELEAALKIGTGITGVPEEQPASQQEEQIA